MREAIWFFFGCGLGWALTYLKYNNWLSPAPKKRKYVRKPKIENPATLKE